MLVRMTTRSAATATATSRPPRRCRQRPRPRGRRPHPRRLRRHAHPEEAQAYGLQDDDTFIVDGGPAARPATPSPARTTMARPTTTRTTDTPAEDVDVALFATKNQLGDLIDAHGLDVDKSLKVDELRSTVAAALTPEA